MSEATCSRRTKQQAWLLQHQPQGCLVLNHLAQCERTGYQVVCLGWPNGALTGKPVRFRRGPAAVFGDEPRDTTALWVGRHEGRTIREPEDLPEALRHVDPARTGADGKAQEYLCHFAIGPGGEMREFPSEIPSARAVAIGFAVRRGFSRSTVWLVPPDLHQPGVFET